MKTSAIVLALATSALAANVNVLMRKENAVCRTYTSKVLVPCSTSMPMPSLSSTSAPSSSVPPAESSTPPAESSSSTPPASSSTPPASSSSSTPPASSLTPPASSSSSSSSSSAPPASTPTPSKTTTSSSSTTSSAPESTKTYATVPGFYCGCEWLINDETLYCVNKTTGAYQVEFQNLAKGRGAKFNALAFHPQTIGLVSIVDDPGYQNPMLTFIDGAGGVNYYEQVTTKWKVGEIDEDSQYWVMDNTTWANYDLDLFGGPKKDGANLGKVKASGPINFGYYVYDWAYLQGTGKYLWSIGTSKADGSSALVRWNMDSSSWSVVQNYGNLDGVNQWGPAWGYLDSKLWMQESQTGDIYQITVPSGRPTKISTAQVITPAFNNDGAKCWNNTLSYNKKNGPPPPGY